MDKLTHLCLDFFLCKVELIMSAFLTYEALHDGTGTLKLPIAVPRKVALLTSLCKTTEESQEHLFL